MERENKSKAGILLEEVANLLREAGYMDEDEGEEVIIEALEALIQDKLILEEWYATHI